MTGVLEGVRSGGALVVAQQLGDNEAQRAADILNRHNAVDIDRARERYLGTTGTTSSMSYGGRASDASPMGSGSFYQGGDTVIPIVEEEISVGKREVESGGIRVETRVEETPVQEQVTLRDEHVQVQRRPVNQAIDPSAVDQVLQEGTFEMREHDEHAVVDKQAHVVEEVVIGKEVQQRTETIQETARRTDVNVEEIPGTTRTATEPGTSGAAGDVGQRDPRSSA